MSPDSIATKFSIFYMSVITHWRSMVADDNRRFLSKNLFLQANAVWTVAGFARGSRCAMALRVCAECGMRRVLEDKIRMGYG